MKEQPEPRRTVEMKIPTGSIAGWRTLLERAKDVYWNSRRMGGTENEALAAVLDDAFADKN